jgi:hypothetical protein
LQRFKESLTTRSEGRNRPFQPTLGLFFLFFPRNPAAIPCLISLNQIGKRFGEHFFDHENFDNCAWFKYLETPAWMMQSIFDELTAA